MTNGGLVRLQLRGLRSRSKVGDRDKDGEACEKRRRSESRVPVEPEAKGEWPAARNRTIAPARHFTKVHGPKPR